MAVSRARYHLPRRRLSDGRFLRALGWAQLVTGSLLGALAASGLLPAWPLAVTAALLLIASGVLALWTRPDDDEPATTSRRQLESTRQDLLATISHEFRTPLTAIQGAALTLRKHGDRLDEERTRALLDAIIANTERLGRLLENMLTVAEARSPGPQAVADVQQVATEVTAVIESDHPERTQRIVVAADDGLEARVEPAALHQILANLLSNAVIHAQPGSQAIISAAADGADIVVTVANEGQSIDADTLAEQFKPFTQQDSSTTRAYEGAGIGLYVVRRLVEVSSGSLRVHSTPGWVSVEVRLPRAAPRTVDLTAAEASVELDH